MDKLERLTKEALDDAGLAYIQDGEKGKHGATKHLDFFLPDQGVYIEVCAAYTPRKIEQASRAENVIILQGYKSVLLFCKYLGTNK